MEGLDEGALTVTVMMKVSPDAALRALIKRYRDALAFAIRRVYETKTKATLKEVHRLLYEELKAWFGLPPRIAIDCEREALAIYKGWKKNPKKGKLPLPKKLSMWLTFKQGYRVKGNVLEIAGGVSAKIIGWDRRYDEYENREARLVYEDGEFYLFVTKKIPKPKPIETKGALAVDVNEAKIEIGNHEFHKEIATPLETAAHYKLLAEGLQEKYSSGRYRPWLTRQRIRGRIGAFHEKANNIVEDWAKKASLEIVKEAQDRSLAIVREDLTGLIKAIRRLPKSHKTRLISLAYRRLEYWIDWQAQKHGVLVKAVDPAYSSSTCPVCGSRLAEVGYRRMKCSKCGFEEDRDVIAILNLERMGGPLAAPTAPEMKDVSPNRSGEPIRPEGVVAL